MNKTKRVCDLKPDDIVDLENDYFADPDGDNVEYACAHQIVVAVVPETATCTLVQFDAVSVGFHPQHLVQVR